MGVKINRSITTNNKWIYFLHDNKHQGQELSIVREQSVAWLPQSGFLNFPDFSLKNEPTALKILPTNPDNIGNSFRLSYTY